MTRTDEEMQELHFRALAIRLELNNLWVIRDYDDLARREQLELQLEELAEILTEGDEQ